MKSAIAAVAVSVALVGCAASGVQVKDEQLSSLAPGETTQQEVIAALGKPTSRIRNSDGTTTILYTYAEARTRASTFIPIVGLFAGGVDTNHSTAILRFDKEGKLIDHSMSEGEMGTATGVSVDASPVQNQPRKP